MDTFMAWVGIIAGVIVVIWFVSTQNKEAAKGAEQLVCPHCHTRGTVTGKSGISSKGVSGGKAAGAVVTGGLSVFATGLSKNERVRKLTCSKCNSTWDA